MENSANKIGEQLRSLREAHKLCELQVAGYMGVSTSVIYAHERGEIDAPVHVLEKLCNLYGCEVADLYTGNPIDFLQGNYREIWGSDLVAMADLNRIALNGRQMESIMRVAKMMATE